MQPGVMADERSYDYYSNGENLIYYSGKPLWKGLSSLCKFAYAVSSDLVQQFYYRVDFQLLEDAGFVSTHSSNL